MRHEVSSPGVGGKATRAALLVVCLCLLLAPGKTGLADEQALLATDPSPALVGVNGLVNVSLVISNVEDLYGAQVSLTFDPAVVKVIDADPSLPGVQISPGEFPYPDWVVRRMADNEAGTIEYAVTQLSPREPVSGEGVLATITFAGLKPGETDLVFQSYILADVNADNTDAAWVEGELQTGSYANFQHVVSGL